MTARHARARRWWQRRKPVTIPVTWTTEPRGLPWSPRDTPGDVATGMTITVTVPKGAIHLRDGSWIFPVERADGPTAPIPSGWVDLGYTSEDA